MKRRFEKRASVRSKQLVARHQRRMRDRHDRAWLVGAGGCIGNWKIVSGLWREQDGHLVNVVSGTARGPYTNDVGQWKFIIFDPTLDKLKMTYALGRKTTP